MKRISTDNKKLNSSMIQTTLSKLLESIQANDNIKVKATRAIDTLKKLDAIDLKRINENPDAEHILSQERFEFLLSLIQDSITVDHPLNFTAHDELIFTHIDKILPLPENVQENTRSKVDYLISTINILSDATEQLKTVYPTKIELLSNNIYAYTQIMSLLLNLTNKVPDGQAIMPAYFSADYFRHLLKIRDKRELINTILFLHTITPRSMPLQAIDLDNLFTHYTEWNALAKHKGINDRLRDPLIARSKFQIFREVSQLFNENSNSPPDELLELAINHIEAAHRHYARANMANLSDINPSQSTHRASVHQSVSKSARDLNEYYKMKAKPIKPMATLTAFLFELQGLKASKETNQTHLGPAISALEHIIDCHFNNHMQYIDPASGVKTTNLLTMAVMTLEDDECRTITGQTGVKITTASIDARNRIIECLYDIQRGYNQDERGNDLGGRDKPICTAGTFNKIVESMNGVVHCVEITLMTREIALAGLKDIIHRAAKNHIMSLPRITAEELASVHTRLNDLNRDTTFEPISSVLFSTVMDEFKSFYQGAYTSTEAMEVDVRNGISYLEIKPNFLNQIRQEISHPSQTPTLFSNPPTKNKSADPDPNPPSKYDR